MVRDKVAKLLDSIKSDKGSLIQPGLLKDLSPFLSSYHICNQSETDVIEIPGQYGDISGPLDPSNNVRITSFNPKITVFNSMRKPIKISMIGDNGKSYDWIIKRGEDLRQDERIQQFFRVLNSILAHDNNNRKCNRLITYNVVPMSLKLGIIQFLSNTTTYGTLATPPKIGIQKERDEFIKVFKGDKLWKTPDTELISTFRNLKCGNHESLKESFMKLAINPEGFYFLRDNYIRSHGLTSLSHWLLSIGDRHAENFLISKITGESIGIDFGYSFGTTAFLPIAEIVPFRLTPRIQCLNYPFRSGEGPMKETMMAAYKALRSQKDVLEAIVDIFIREPTVDWKMFAEKQKSVHKNKNKNKDDFSQQKMKIFRRKLNGDNPLEIAFDELNQGIPRDYFPQLKRTLQSIHEFDDDDDLNEGEIVDILLKNGVESSTFSTDFCRMETILVKLYFTQYFMYFIMHNK